MGKLQLHSIFRYFSKERLLSEKVRKRTPLKVYFTFIKTVGQSLLAPPPKVKEVMFSPLSVCLFVCLFVCLSVCRISQKVLDGSRQDLVFSLGV